LPDEQAPEFQSSSTDESVLDKGVRRNRLARCFRPVLREPFAKTKFSSSSYSIVKILVPWRDFVFREPHRVSVSTDGSRHWIIEIQTLNKTRHFHAWSFEVLGFVQPRIDLQSHIFS
jgi:hypothetical protein